MRDRRAPPSDDGAPVSRLEVEFAISVFWTPEQVRALCHLLDNIVRAPCNQTPDGVHWVSSYGSKPSWSQADAFFLGKPVDPNAPTHGEPTFDDTVLHIETSARPFVSEREKARALAEDTRDESEETE